MTPIETARAIAREHYQGEECNRGTNEGLRIQIQDAIEQAIAAERERCAKIADALSMVVMAHGEMTMAKEIAAEIRDGKK